MDPVLVGTVPSRVWMCLGSGSNALSPKFATGKASRTVEGWELANKLGSQQTEEAVAGDPLGNKFIIIIILVIIILFRCVNFLCGQKYPRLRLF